MKPRDTDKTMTVNRGSKKSASTKTSSFGVSKREGHDSSKYYDSKMYREIPSESDVGDPQEFPEFLMAVAEENFFRGYEQALVDLQESNNLEKERDK